MSKHEPFPCEPGESIVEIGRAVRRSGWIGAVGIVRFQARALTRIRFAVFNPKRGDWHHTDLVYAMVRDLLPAIRHAIEECERLEDEP